MKVIDKRRLPLMVARSIAEDKELTDTDLRFYVDLLVWEQTGELQEKFKNRDQDFEDTILHLAKKGYVEFPKEGGVYLP